MRNFISFIRENFGLYTIFLVLSNKILKQQYVALIINKKGQDFIIKLLLLSMIKATLFKSLEFLVASIFLVYFLFKVFKKRTNSKIPIKKFSLFFKS